MGAGMQSKHLSVALLAAMMSIYGPQALAQEVVAPSGNNSSEQKVDKSWWQGIFGTTEAPPQEEATQPAEEQPLPQVQLPQNPSVRSATTSNALPPEIMAEYEKALQSVRSSPSGTVSLPPEVLSEYEGAVNMINNLDIEQYAEEHSEDPHKVSISAPGSLGVPAEYIENLATASQNALDKSKEVIDTSTSYTDPINYELPGSLGNTKNDDLNHKITAYVSGRFAFSDNDVKKIARVFGISRAQVKNVCVPALFIYAKSDQEKYGNSIGEIVGAGSAISRYTGRLYAVAVQALAKCALSRPPVSQPLVIRQRGYYLLSLGDTTCRLARLGRPASVYVTYVGDGNATCRF